MKLNFPLTIIFISIIIILSNCGGFNEIGPFFERPVSMNQIFIRDCNNCIGRNNSINAIKVEPYFYLDSNKVYYVNGDLSLQNIVKFQDFKYIDSVSSKPAFQWTGDLNYKLVTVAIFKNRIETTEKEIKNKDDIVWLWHSGLGTGRFGSLKFTDGKKVDNGKIDESISPLPLAKGKLYTWGIWAWNQNGEKIIASSREQMFIVK